MSAQYNNKNDEKETKLPFSFFFLKSIVAGLGVTLVVGFAGLVAVIVLGAKVFTDKADCDSFRPAREVTLTPRPTGDILSARLNKGPVELLIRTKGEGVKLLIYESETGKPVSKIALQKDEKDENE